jgi:MFS family permease
VTRGVGLLGGAFAFGSGLGLIVGGVIVDHVGWHSIFLVSACTACLTILLTLLFVPSLKPAPRTGRLDIVGGVLFAPAVCMVLLAVSQASTIAAHSYTTITLAVFGFLGLVFWISHELRHENPLIDVRILKNRQVLWANISIFFAGMGPLISVTVIMPFFQQPVWTGAGFGIPATAAALIKLPANGTSVIAAIVAGYAASRYGVRTVLLWAAFISTVGWALVVAANTSLVVIAVLQIIALAPVQSVLFSLTPRAIMQVAPQDRTSEATGLTQVIRALGQAVGVQMMAMLLASSMVSRAGEGRFPAHSSYILAFVYIGIFSFLIWLALLALPREKPGYHLPS